MSIYIFQIDELRKKIKRRRRKEEVVVEEQNRLTALAFHLPFTIYYLQLQSSTFNFHPVPRSFPHKRTK